MPLALNINEFLKLSETHPILDVRTPAEFEKGHIPGAVNIPLFTNEERVTIGTLYKQQGKQPAVLKGLEFVGPKLHLFISEALKLQNSGTFLFHCWRGGMRSSSMAWLFETYGLKCVILKGGYKSYRKHVLEGFNEKKNLIILGGRTGTGKTQILHELKSLGEAIIDLEAIAHHKGSSFGAFGEKKQSSQEQFENELFDACSLIDAEKKCWVEDESRKIGSNALPEGFWEQMRNAKVVYVDLDTEARTQYLVAEYGKFTKEELIAATERIGKRLGGQHVKAAVEAIESGDLTTACKISLVYYDKAYDFGLSKRPPENIISKQFDTLDPAAIANEIKDL